MRPSKKNNKPNKMQPILISDGWSYPYQWQHPKYGWAGFSFCFVYNSKAKDGVLQGIYIQPGQQEDKRLFFLDLKGFNKQGYSMISWSHKGYIHPQLVDCLWCSDHKGIWQYWNVPKDTNNLTISVCGDTVKFYFDKK